jgi:hypothetical protein
MSRKVFVSELNKSKFIPAPFWVPGNRDRLDSVILFIIISWDARDEYEVLAP